MKQKAQFTLLLTDAGMGDMVGYLVAVNYLIKTFNHIQFNIWVPDYLYQFAQHVLPPGSEVFKFSGKAKLDPNVPGLSTAWNGIHTPMRTHPVDYAFHVLADRHEYNLENKNYLQITPTLINTKRFKLPENYACIVTTAAEPCKALPPEVLNGIADHVIQKGLTPVFLGKEIVNTGFNDLAITATTISVDYSKGINLVNKTSMLEAAKIMGESQIVIGMDSGLIHLAGCTDTRIIAGYSLVDPIHIAPIRKASQSYKFLAVEPDLDIENRYYQTNNNFKAEDYRSFPYKEVIQNLTLDKWLKAIDYT